MKLDEGQRLGPYEIVSILGAGGMGEVYRARDTRLGREVAIKVLPETVRANPDSLARFEREARAIAALSHPNILAIHDFGEHDGTAYTVVELLEGETLREALAGGSLPQRKAIEYARQIARGLGAAHDGGVVHRDLKPENLFVTRDGRLKILDFGLARAGDPAGEDSDDKATQTHLTDPGTVLGTINYMSPEQASGRPAGPPSDIFSLGTVLFEMLNGERPFERKTAPETMTAILREDPPELTTGEGPALRRIVQRCLEKSPEERFQSAHDLAFALETSSEISSGVATVAAVEGHVDRQGRRGRVPWWTVAAALSLGLIGGALFQARLNTEPAGEPVKISPITFSGFDANPAASPDGRTLVFASRRGDAEGIWVKQLNGGGEARLTQGDDDNPRFSIDGATVLFRRNQGSDSSIYRVPLVGGEPRKLIDGGTEADWSPDGSRLIFARSAADASSLGIANADGTDERTLLETGRRTIASPRWSPDGSTIAFVSGAQNNVLPISVMLLDVASGEARELPPQRPSLSGLAWSGDGAGLVFGWSEDLLSGTASTAVRISIQNVSDGTTRDLFWSRNLLLNQFGTQIDIVGPGRLVFGTLGATQSLRETTLDGNDAGARTLTTGNSMDRQPVYSPDGETILFSSNRNGNLDLWTLHTRSGGVRQLTDDEARDWDPAFVGDGSRIVWSSDRSGNLEIWTADADGSSARQVSRDGVDAENPSVTPDGEWVVYMTSNPEKTGIWKVRLDGSEATHIWKGSGFIPELSPDGRHVVFARTGGPATNNMFVLDMQTGEVEPFAEGLVRELKFGASSVGRARWMADGSSIIFLSTDRSRLGVMTQRFVPGQDTHATRRPLAGFDPEWTTESFDVSPDGKRIVVSRGRPGDAVMLAENVPLVMPPVRP